MAKANANIYEVNISFFALLQVIYCYREGLFHKLSAIFDDYASSDFISYTEG